MFFETLTFFCCARASQHDPEERNNPEHELHFIRQTSDFYFPKGFVQISTSCRTLGNKLPKPAQLCVCVRHIKADWIVWFTLDPDSGLFVELTSKATETQSCAFLIQTKKQPHIPQVCNSSVSIRYCRFVAVLRWNAENNRKLRRNFTSRELPKPRPLDTQTPPTYQMPSIYWSVCLSV